MSFPKDFAWGAATSAYQIEGAVAEDGRADSIWDKFCHQKGKVYAGETGDVACDHYHRFREDVALMKKIGLTAYRFSISWPRVIPAGIGAVNPKGLKFYSDLVDELLANDIVPYVTLFHWDLPYELHKKGGWMNRESIDWFANYAKVVTEALSDRVTHFFTMNEPQCFVGGGYEIANAAPGYRVSNYDTMVMAHHALCAHGAAVKAMRAAAKQDIIIGYAPTGSLDYPATDSPEDIEAARRANFSLPPMDAGEQWTWNISWWSDPVYLGCYPEEGLRKYHKYLPEITKEDMALIHQPIDLLGYNIYNGIGVKMGEDGTPQYLHPRAAGAPKSGADWPLTPESLYWGPRYLHERYPDWPIAVTENGIALPDVVSVDGKVHDPNRIDFMARYLTELKRACEDGVPVCGYFTWSLMDNFEWASGYSQRFGITYVDYQTQKRTLKDSAYWYHDLILQNGENLG